MKGAALIAALVALAFAARADPQLLAICSTTTQAGCTRETQWSVAKVALTPSLQPASSASPARFLITVTEGATAEVLTARTDVSLTGLLPGGTEVAAVFLALQRGDGQGGYTTVAAGGVGRTDLACECPLIASGDLTVIARDGTGKPIATLPDGSVATLAFGDSASLQLDARYSLAQGLIAPGDAVRLSACVSYVPAAASYPPGCFADGGGVRNVKACSGFSLGQCADQGAQVALTESLGAASSAVATLGAFTASSASPYLSPAGPQSLVAGGAPLHYTVARSGIAGTQTAIEVDGPVACGTCTDPNGCLASFTNTAALPSATSSASVQVSCPGQRCTDFGAAGHFNLFTRGDINMKSGDVQGAASGRNVTLTGYSIANMLPQGPPPPMALVAAGALNFSSGQIHGDAFYGTTAQVIAPGQPGSVIRGLPFDFAAASQRLLVVNSALAAMPANGNAIMKQHTLQLTGTDPRLNVFGVGSADFVAANNYNLSIPAGSFALIRVTGDALHVGGGGFNYGVTPDSSVLYQFAAASSLEIQGGFRGSILAPYAAISFVNGAIDGQVFAGSATGGGEMKLEAMDCLPVP